MGGVNQQGKEVIPFKYDNLKPFVDGIAKAQKGNNWGLIDMQGRAVSEDIEEVSAGVFKAKQFGKWGFQDETGNKIYPFVLDVLEPFENGVARAKKNGGWGLIDLQGKAIREDVEEVSAGVFKAKQFGKWGLQDEDGNEIYPFVLNDLQPFENGIARVKEGGYWEKWGCINLQGEVIIPFYYAELYPFVEGIARATKEHKEYVGLRTIRKQRWGCVNQQGEEVIPFEYESIEPFQDGIARAERYGHWGCINLKGEAVIPFKYSSIDPFEDGIAKVKKGYIWGKIDAQGRSVSEEVEEVSAGVFKAKQFGKWGLQDTEGETICPFEYDRVVAAQGGYITYKGEFRSTYNRRSKGKFAYVPLPMIEGKSLEAVVVNRVKYGVFVSIDDMPATLIHKSTLNKAGLSRIYKGDKLNVVVTGIDEKYGVLAVELVEEE